MHRLLLLTLLFSIPGFVAAQTQGKAEKILLRAAAACRQVQQGTYTAIYKQKSRHSPDTISIRATVHFSKIPDDLIGAKMALLTGIEDRIYNGQEVFLINHPQKTVQRITAAQGATTYIRGSSIGELALNPLAVDSNVFERLAKKQSVSKVLGKKVNVGNETCYTITLRFPDSPTNRTRNSVRTYCISTRDYLPRSYEDKMDWEGQHQYRYFELSDLKINQPQDEGIYSAERLVEEYNLEGKTQR